MCVFVLLAASVYSGAAFPARGDRVIEFIPERGFKFTKKMDPVFLFCAVQVVARDDADGFLIF